MNDYAVKKAPAKRGGQSNNAASAAQSVNGIPNSVLTDVFAGKRRATNEMMGHREELAPSIAAKMSQSFGMDFSAVKVYRSDAMAGTEMHGMAQGDKVVLSSDVDLNTQAGQAVLGHELSHIRAQSMGMGSGRGLLNDAALEHQADSEGMLAARGMNIGGESMGMSMGLGMAGVEGLSPIGAGLGASASAPMQADKGEESYHDLINKRNSGQFLTKDEAKQIDGYQKKHPELKTIDSVNWMMDGDTNIPHAAHHEWRQLSKQAFQLLASGPNGDRGETIRKTFPKGFQFKNLRLSNGPNNTVRDVSGLDFNRVLPEMNTEMAKYYKDEQLIDMFQNIFAGHDQKDRYTNNAYDKQRLKGFMTYKEMVYQHLQNMENKYGKLLHQMHPEDLMERFGIAQVENDFGMVQDTMQFFQSTNSDEMNQLVRFEDDDKEKNFQRLANAYFAPSTIAKLFQQLSKENTHFSSDNFASENINELLVQMAENPEYSADNIHAGPSLSGEALDSYNKSVQKKIKQKKYRDFSKL